VVTSRPHFQLKNCPPLFIQYTSNHPSFWWEGVIGGCRKLHYDNFYSFPNTVTNKSKRMGLLGHAAHVGETQFRYERLMERECLEDIDVDGSITLICIFKK
jgi:hypothetical protein